MLDFFLILGSVMALVTATDMLLFPNNRLVETLVLPLCMLPVVLMIHWVALQLYLHN